MSKLTIDLKIGETLRIGGASIRLEKKSGQLARLAVVADPSILVTTPANSRETADTDARKSAPQFSQGEKSDGEHTLRLR